MSVIWVAGGRDYDDATYMRERLAEEATEDAVLITGAARGADLRAEMIWRQLQLPYIGVPARWRVVGDAAGPIRNAVIADGFLGMVPEGLIAFPGDFKWVTAIALAKARGIPLL